MNNDFNNINNNLNENAENIYPNLNNNNDSLYTQQTTSIGSLNQPEISQPNPIQQPVEQIGGQINQVSEQQSVVETQQPSFMDNFQQSQTSQPISQQPIEQPNYNTNPTNTFYENYSNANNFSSPVMDDNFDKKEKIKKALIIVIVIVVAGIAISFGINKIFNKTNPSVKTIFDEDQYIAIKKDGKYGYINTDGKIVIEPQYDYATDFNGDYGLVANDIADDEYNNKYLFIDKKGNVKLEKISSPTGVEFSQTYNTWYVDDQLYDAKLNLLSPEGASVIGYSFYDEKKYLTWNTDTEGGIIRADGKITYKTKLNNDSRFYVSYDDVSSQLKNHYCRAQLNEKQAIVNCDTGKVVMDYQNGKISVEENNIFEIVDDDYNTLSTFYVQGDKILYKTDDPNIELRYYSDGNFIEIEDESKDYNEPGKYKHIDVATGKILDGEGTQSSSSEEISLEYGYTVYRDEETYNYGVKKGDNIVIEPKYDGIEYLDNYSYSYLMSKGKEYFIGKKRDESNSIFHSSFVYEIIDVKSKKVVQSFTAIDFDIEEFSTFIVYTDRETEKDVILNLLTGKTLEVDGSISAYASHVEVEKDDITKFYNTDLKLIYTQED